MKRSIIIALGALALSTAPLLARDLIDISPEDTVVVERYVREVPLPPPPIVEHMTLRPGSVIPPGVELSRFTDKPSLARYAFFVSVDHKIVVADPKTRVVVRILDQKS